MIDTLEKFKEFLFKGNYPYIKMNVENSQVIGELFDYFIANNHPGTKDFIKLFRKWITDRSIEMFGKKYMSARSINFWIVRGFDKPHEIDAKNEYI